MHSQSLRVGCLAMLMVLLAACGGGPAATTSPLNLDSTAVGQANPTPSTAPTAAEPTVAEPTPANPEEPTLVPETPSASPTLAQAPSVQGEPVLRIKRGAGADQISPQTLPRYRIGADGSIRVLDVASKRLMVYTPDGKLQRTLDFPDAVSPVHFIINVSGEIYLLDAPLTEQARILRYSPAAALLESIPVHQSISAHSINLATDQTLTVIGGMGYWVIRHKDTLVKPELQVLSGHPGVVTPRSAMVFGDKFEVAGLNISAADHDNIAVPFWIHTPFPKTAHFFNIDREMNPYVVSLPETETAKLTFWKLNVNDPAPAAAGSAAIDLQGCNSGFGADLLNSTYLDQSGVVWLMCFSEAEISFQRYRLQDTNGQPLADADPKPANVPWAKEYTGPAG